MLAREATTKGYRAASLDIEKCRGMNILRSSGFARLVSNMCMRPYSVDVNRVCTHHMPPFSVSLLSRTFLASILNGRPSGFVSWLAVVCSSWVDASRGSTKRSWVMPEGHDGFASVHAGNVMVSRYLDCSKIVYVRGSHANRSPETRPKLPRPCKHNPFKPVQYPALKVRYLQALETADSMRCSFILLLTIAAGGNWILEQPRSSLLFRHPRMRWVCQCHKVRICRRN